jgi:hypothetical protein
VQGYRAFVSDEQCTSLLVTSLLQRMQQLGPPVCLSSVALGLLVETGALRSLPFAFSTVSSKEVLLFTCCYCTIAEHVHQG